MPRKKPTAKKTTKTVSAAAPKDEKKSSGLKYFIWITVPVLVLLLVLVKTNKLNFASIGDLFRARTIVVEFPEEKIFGAWVWESPDGIGQARRNEIMAFAKKEGIDTLFLDLGKYTDIADAEDVSSVQVEEYTDAIRQFIRAARENGIEVHALGGTPSWGYSEEWYIPLALAEFVMEFNDRNPETRFSGIQYDVEYYNHETYKDDEALRDSEFIMLAEQIMRKVNLYNNATENPIRLGFVVPYWLKEQKLTPVFEPLMNLLNENGGSYVVVLAYRTDLKGDTGTLAISKDELDYAEMNASRVSVVIGQETDSSADTTPFISFYGRSKKDVRDTVKGITAEFGDYRSFGGVAINQLSSFQKLKD